MESQPMIIDLDNWVRREHYEFFKQYPVPFTIGWLHVVSLAADAVPEFRQRIRDGAPIEHPLIHPSVTVLCEGDVLRFRFVTYSDSLDQFAPEAA